MPRDIDFLHTMTEEPHALRREEILRKYPEIKTLMYPEWRTKYIVLLTVLFQVYMAAHAATWTVEIFVCAAYVFGATANQSLFLAIHELSHNLAFKRRGYNKLLAVAANTPIGVPYCMLFKPFHLQHHRDLGFENSDTDIPTALEVWVISGSAKGKIDHAIRKAIFLCLHIFAYALRPMLVQPHLIVLDYWVLLNWATQTVFNALIVYSFGWSGLVYFILSSVMAASLHPTAGHFISEHYLLTGVEETSSYYGPLNYISYNVGYHNEHHDFPNIPWSRLPLVTALAPEFYLSLPQCHSWPGAIVQYVFNDSVGPFSRLLRKKQ